MVYNLLLVVHIAAVVWAFGPLFAYTAVSKAAVANGGAEASRTIGALAGVQKTSLVPLLVAVGAGVGLVINGGYDFSAPWISAAFTIVILLIALSVFFLLPTLRKLETQLAEGASGEDVKTTRAMVAMGTGLFHLALVAIIVLMIWQPGR